MIYMDNAATTRMRREVLEAMMPAMTFDYGNPSANYEFAVKQKNAIEQARSTIASTIGCKPSEIYFTSGGTESDNWAVKSVAFVNRRTHLITSKIEHHAIFHACKFLEERGVSVSYIDVDSDGLIRLDELERAIRPDTRLISVMTANNEIGTIQPFQKIGEIAGKHNVLFHTDAVQAYSSVPINVERDHIDMMSVSAHKICGPKGVGFLYIREGCGVPSYLHGGAQERNLRAGTENVAGIIGMAKAVQIAFENMKFRIARELQIRNHMIMRILREIPYAKLNGHRIDRLPNNINFSFGYVDGGTLIAMLDHQNICASSGSACTSSSKSPSHVLKAIGLTDEMAHAAVRLTINENVTLQQADYVVNCLKQNVRKLQSLY